MAILTTMFPGSVVRRHANKQSISCESDENISLATRLTELQLQQLVITRPDW